MLAMVLLIFVSFIVKHDILFSQQHVAMETEDVSIVVLIGTRDQCAVAMTTIYCVMIVRLAEVNKKTASSFVDCSWIQVLFSVLNVA